MKKFAAGLVVIAACGGVTAEAAPIGTTTTMAPTTTLATTTTTQSTTTTVPTRTVDIDVVVYDDPTGSLQEGESCTASATFSFVFAGATVVLEDANTGEILGSARLGPGHLDYEEVATKMPADVVPLFWTCVFEASLHDVAANRSFHVLRVEGDTVDDEGMIYGLDELRTGFVAPTYFFTTSEETRQTYR